MSAFLTSWCFSKFCNMKVFASLVLFCIYSHQEKYGKVGNGRDLVMRMSGR